MALQERSGLPEDRKDAVSIHCSHEVVPR
jgi:hypothetical protein